MVSDAGTLGLNEQIAQLADQLQQPQMESQAATALRQANSLTTSGASPGGASTGQSIGSTLLDVFGAGLGLSPLISGLASLFGGSGDGSTSSSTPAPLTKFALPTSIQVNGGVSEGGGQAFAVDNPQGGLPRAVPTGGQASAPAQITVQVQAMDSQSFLDHSGDIAMAVRQAMLQSSVLNDVVREA
jgi:hypothetical protein